MKSILPDQENMVPQVRVGLGDIQALLSMLTGVPGLPAQSCATLSQARDTATHAGRSPATAGDAVDCLSPG